MEKQEAFKIHASLLRDAVALLEERARQNDEEARKPQAQGAEDVLFNTFRTRSTRIFAQYLSFLADEILVLDDSKAVFRLPILRTLMDIYSRFLYVHDDLINNDTRFLKLLSLQLLAYRRLPVQVEFEKIVGLYSKHLDEIKPDFPRRWDEFDFFWVRDNDLQFPTSATLLTAEKMKAYAPKASKVFGAQKQQEIYAYFSEIFHGNPFLSHGGYRERYWLASLSVGLTAYFLELIDGKVFHNDKKRDFRDWLKEAQDKKAYLVQHWQLERDMQ